MNNKIEKFNLKQKHTLGNSFDGILTLTALLADLSLCSSTVGTVLYLSPLSTRFVSGNENFLYVYYFTFLMHIPEYKPMLGLFFTNLRKSFKTTVY